MWEVVRHALLRSSDLRRLDGLELGRTADDCLRAVHPRNGGPDHGTATRSIPPDLAIARFEFSARDSTFNAAARGAAAIGDAIRRAVAKAGVPDDSILGRDLSLMRGTKQPSLKSNRIPEFNAMTRRTSFATSWWLGYGI